MLIKNVLLQEQLHLEFYNKSNWTQQQQQQQTSQSCGQGLQHQQNQVLKWDVTALLAIMGEWQDKIYWAAQPVSPEQSAVELKPKPTLQQQSLSRSP